MKQPLGNMKEYDRKNIKDSSETQKRIPIALITGSSGSGKTTLVKRILEHTDRRIAVIMYEFGEIGIDSWILKGENIPVLELAGGCDCCDLTVAYEAAVSDFIERIKPELIMVEATGVADADSLFYEMEEDLSGVRLKNMIYIFDALADVRFPDIEYATRRQIQEADAVLINKVDLVNPAQLRKIENQIRKYNETATFFRCNHCDLNVRLLFDVEVKPHHRIEVERSEHGCRSFYLSSRKVFCAEKFRKLVYKLPPNVNRVKGFIRLDEGEFLFNYVAGRSEWEKFAGGGTQLVFIGRDFEKVKTEILSQLRKCEVP